MTAQASTNNINETSTTQPCSNGQEGHSNELPKPLLPVLLPERTTSDPLGLNKASTLNSRIQQTKGSSPQIPSLAVFRPTISALGPSQTLNGISTSLSNASSSSTSPTFLALTGASGGTDTPKKGKKAVRVADPQSRKRSSGDPGSDDKIVRKKRAANPLAMSSPDGFGMSPISGSIVDEGSPNGSAKARGWGPLRMTPKDLNNAPAEVTALGGGGYQEQLQWPKTTDKHPTTDGTLFSPPNSTQLPLLPTEGLSRNLNDLMNFLDRFQEKWQDERVELITEGLTDLDRIQLLLQVTTSPFGHVSTIRDYLQSRCEPRVTHAGKALRPTLQNILDHLACAQKSRTSNAVRILLATTAFLMITLTLELDQIPVAGLYMINETYFRPDEDWPTVGQRIHPSIISLKYLAGLWEDVLRRSEDCSYILDLTLNEYESISEALATLREVWEVEGRVDLEEVGSMETKVDRVLRILGRKIRQLKAEKRRPRVTSTDAVVVTPIHGSTVSTPHHRTTDTGTRSPSTTIVPTTVPTTASAPNIKATSQMTGTTITGISSVQATPIFPNDLPSTMDGRVVSTLQQPKKPRTKHIAADALKPNRASATNATTLSASLMEQTPETSSWVKTPTPATVSSPPPSSAPTSTSSSPLTSIQSRATSLPQPATSPSPATPALNGTVRSTPVTGRATPSSRKVVSTLASLSPVRSSFAASSSSAVLSASPTLHGSTGASKGGNAKTSPGTVYSMFPPYGRVNIGPAALSPSTEPTTNTTQSMERSSSPSIVDLAMTESQQKRQHRETATEMSSSAFTEVNDQDADEMIIVDDDPIMTIAAFAAPETTILLTKHITEVDSHSRHQGNDESEDAENSTYEPEDQSIYSVNMITKDNTSLKEPVSLTGRKQHYGAKGLSESSGGHTHERAISNATSEPYRDTFQAFTGSEDEEDQLVDEDYDDYDTQPKGVQLHGSRLSPHKTESYLARAPSHLRHESPIAGFSSRLSSVQSLASGSEAASKQTKITAHMQRKIDTAAAVAAANEEAARRRALIERPSWISVEDKDDRDITPGLSSTATSTSTLTDRRSMTPSSSSSRPSMGSRRSTLTPKEKPAKPEPAPLPIKEILTPEEEALAIVRAQQTKDGKVYKMDVKRKGAVIIPAHLYVAPKTLLTPKLTPEELEALAAKTLEGSGAVANRGRRSTRGSGGPEEPLLDLDTAKSIKKLKRKKETALQKEREESAASSSSMASKSTS